jgi:hypothetical protein
MSVRRRFRSELFCRDGRNPGRQLWRKDFAGTIDKSKLFCSD